MLIPLNRNPRPASAGKSIRMIGRPTTSGSRMRFARSRMKPAAPLRSISIRPKNPASRKKSDIRNMWLTKKTTPSVALGGSRIGHNCSGKPST